RSTEQQTYKGGSADPLSPGDPPSWPPSSVPGGRSGDRRPRADPVGGMGHRLSSFPYSAWTALRRPAASCLPPTSFCSSGVQPWAKIDPVAFAMKSIAPLSLDTSAPAASVSLVTDPDVAWGTGRSGGPPGFDPPTATSISRAF